MRFELPTADNLKRIADELGFEMDDAEAGDVLTFMAPFEGAFNAIDDMPDVLPEVTYPRGEATRPTGDDNKHGAWYVKITITGNDDGGRLEGKTVAIKDTMCIAGVPMMNGASVLEGYVPDFDATVVTRILDAGGEILGKSVCEYFSVSGGSATSASGVVESPRNPGHTPGGSSTGSAALVAAGEVDLALGGDQAGSIRIPASYTGIVGMKPTFGLVPYTGIMGMEATIDHAGPITADVADNALLLEAIAGEDGLDGRQRVPRVDSYTNALDMNVEGLRVAVVREGFGREESEADVDDIVRQAARHLESQGAEISEVSIPMHPGGLAIWGAIGAGGMYHTMFRGHGFGHDTFGVYPTSLVDAMSEGAKRAAEFPATMRFGMLLGCWADKAHGGHFYAKAQNQRRALGAAYDRVLDGHDALLMPTTAMKTSPIPAADAGFLEVMKHSWEMIGNTAPFNVSGHPSISIPCGLGAGDRPVGLMLTARRFDEMMLYRIAHAFEQSCDWQSVGATG